MSKSLIVDSRPRSPYLYPSVIAVLVLALIALADYPAIGQVAIGAYALFAFWQQESSRVFALALVALGVVLCSIIVDWYQVVDTFSGYVFLLFMVGVFVMTRELWRFSQELRRQREEDNAK